ncbi:bacillithiol biosynthesis cysteine-adding enzyme BshC [Flavobacterium sp.]|uniref:bacillithiol biosynthesis cysteine-adding enzyme BshC n=1 Tax=Flavobacterium sp. TaxID=239 RepID=UPI0008C59DE3|nr:bacillithiol biosynthesis cysteine-adding enzyme BshC [Flavobacterium sp.]OGS62308.1 MAG: bacillithiol biosynthesis cysteine-adding enzyme BshC [Flavobacteria bacterium GWF1_32_7]HBD25743.1 bacillithiol biosynthesis cysteine-adding enzyme BshC [Flavobacterium sp.]
MPNDYITYQNSGYFSKLIVDYLDQKSELKSLYNRFPTVENFKLQIEEKSKNFPIENREILAKALTNQYQKFEISEATSNNIELLKKSNTYTITTGHQLNLFTGPLYFLYKIISVINLTKELKNTYPENNFVPIYWMATEDHDFDEINFFNFKGKKIQWKRESNGPVGRLNTSGLELVFEQFSTELGLGNNANYLRELFKKSYLEHDNLADATRYLANELFKKEGLVILDGDDSELKKLFIPFAKNELLHQTSFKKVNETLPLLKEYNVQVNPREINLFYIQDNLRERIVFENGNYKINNTLLSFSESEILTELEKNPENFSPNVILRPLYQEVILPNLCYIGGGGELAYWLELKSNFEANTITFPILLLRNSALIATKKQVEKIERLNLNWADVFQNQQILINEKTKTISEFTIDFSEQKEFLKNQFKALNEIANKTDKSFLGAVKAQEVKQLKGLDTLEKKLLKAEKRIHTEKLERIVKIQNELFPNQTLQERKSNFADFYDEANEFEAFFSLLNSHLQPLKQNFNIVII